MIPEHLEQYVGNLEDLSRIGRLPRSVIFIALKPEDYEIGGEMALSPEGLSSAIAAGEFLSKTLPSGDGVKFFCTSNASNTTFVFNVARATSWSHSGKLFSFLSGRFASDINVAALGVNEVGRDCTGASAITDLFCTAATSDIQPNIIVYFGTQGQCQVMVKVLCLMLKISDDGLFIVGENKLFERAVIDLQERKSTFTYYSALQSA